MNMVNGLPTLGSIRFLTGPLAGTTYTITKPITTIGREPTNDIVISDPSVSRQHVQILWNSGSWTIKKVASQNILSINQHEVQQSPLQDHDTIGIGQGTTFLFLSEDSNSTGTQLSAPQPQIQSNPRPGYPSSPGVASAQNIARPAPVAPANAQNPPPLASFPQPGTPSTPGIASVGPAAFNAATPAANIFDSGPKDATQRAPSDGSFGRPGPGGITGIPSIEISTNTDHEKQVYPLVASQQVFDIGRDPSNTIVINRPTVSSFHAQIVREGNQLVLIHPNPKRGRTLNGLTYQGRTIPGTESFRKVLQRGDVFRISDENGTFVSLTYNDGSGQVQDIVPEIRPIPLGAPLLTLGRSPQNTVVLNHPQVSGFHARLEQIQGGYRIVDLNSTNHVYVNAQRITHQMLKPGDEIRIGPFRLTYTGTQLTQQDESNGIRIDALHLKKEGNRGVVLINDISIAIPPRKFVALVGGSGAGKSTLMDALNGLRPAQQGAVLYNGQDYYRHLAAFSTQLGYVPQDDIIHRDLTVSRALYYAARLRLPQDFTEEQIKERINDVLEDVEMTHRRNLLVSKLSGGQRKRVSIALELLANPSVFFLDEPTSGLDPGLDRKMMLLLRKLADKGHTIVLVTHATNNINACDYICFLCQGGRLAYFGPPNDAKAYFGKTDFAEIYSALEPSEENPNIPAEAEARFKQSPDYMNNVITPLNQGPAGKMNGATETVAVTPPKRGNPWKQFVLLSMRYLELLLNDKGNLFILLLQAPLIAIILYFLTGANTFSPGSIAFCPTRADITATTGRIVSYNCQRVVDVLKTPQGIQFAAQQGKSVDQVLNDSIAPSSGGDAQKTLFILIFAGVMFGGLNGVREIVKEAPIYKRERAVNLGITPYLFSKIAILGTFSLLQSLIMVLVVNFKSPFTHSVFLPPLLEIYVSMALASLAGLLTGLLISAVVPNNDRALSLIPLPLIPQVIFAGVVFSLDIPQWLQIPGALFSARWAMAAMGTTVGLHGDKLGADSFSFVSTLFSSVEPSQSIQNTAFTHLLLCWGVLLLMIVLQALAIAWLLKRKDVRK